MVKVSWVMFGVPKVQSVSKFALVASDPISKEVGVNLVVLLCVLCCGGAFRSFQESFWQQGVMERERQTEMG